MNHFLIQVLSKFQCWLLIVAFWSFTTYGAATSEWFRGFFHFFGRDGMPCHPRYCWYLSIFGWNLLDDCCFSMFFPFHGLYWTGISRISTALVNAEFGLQDCGRFWVWTYIYSTYLNPFNHHHIYHWLNMAGISHINHPRYNPWVPYLSSFSRILPIVLMAP